MGKINEEANIQRQNDILNFILNYPGEYSIDEVSELFGISSRTLRSNYGKIFEEHGVKSKSKKKKLIVDKVNKELKLLLKNNLSLEDIKKTYILFSIEYNFNGKVDLDNLLNKLLLEGFYDINISSDESIINKRIYLKRLINELDQSNMICVEGNIITLKNYKKLLDIQEYDLYELLIYLTVLKKIHPISSVYNNLFEKFKILCPSFKDTIFEVNSIGTLSIFDEHKIKIIREAFFNKKSLKITYKNNNRLDKINVEPIGLIYSDIKAQWYLYSIAGEGKNRNRRLLRLDKIIFIEISDECTLESFNKEDYINSVGVNIGKLHGVEIHFENEDFIRRKIEVYAKKRSTTILKEEDNKIIFIDKVSGLTEIEVWVRGFGKSAKCIKPESLVKRMENNILLLKERYDL